MSVKIFGCCILIVFSFLMNSESFSQTPGSQPLPPGAGLNQKQGTPIVTAPLNTPLGITQYYSSQGFSVIGPLPVDKVNNSTINFVPFPERQEGITVNLQNRSITVKSASGEAASLSTVVPGTHIMVCEKGNTVVIILVDPPKRESSHAR